MWPFETHENMLEAQNIDWSICKDMMLHPRGPSDVYWPPYLGPIRQSQALTLKASCPSPPMTASTAAHFNLWNPSTLCTYLADYECLAEAAQPTLDECLAQSTCYLTEEDKHVGKTSLNLMLHLQIGTPSRKLFLGSIWVLGNPPYHKPIWKLFLMRNQSRRFIPSMTMPSSTENLGGWQHIWPRRRKYLTSASVKPMKTAFIPPCATKYCSTYMTRRLLPKEARHSR